VGQAGRVGHQQQRVLRQRPLDHSGAYPTISCKCLQLAYFTFVLLLINLIW
jgi:hypothetical protein